MLLLALLVPLAARAPVEHYDVHSPDRKLEARVAVHGGVLTYRLKYDRKPVLLDSRLGFEGWPQSWHVISYETRTHTGMWRPLYGERAVVPDHYRALQLDLASNDGRHGMNIVIRAYNEGLALRYRFTGVGRFRVLGEQTEFRFPAGSRAWQEYGTEGEYSLVPLDQIKDNCERPLTVLLASGLYAAVTEAANLNFPRILLGAGRARLDSPAEGALPFDTPWRVIFVGRRPGDLLEHNYLPLNLNAPSAIADTSWIKPGKVIREVTLSTRGGKECVDFAVKQGLQYIEYDAGWYGYEYDDAADATRVSLDPRRVGGIRDHTGLDLEEVIRYAREHGIGVLLYVNRRALERQLDTLLPLYRRWGVAGVKFGFVQTGPQRWTAWLHDAVRKAAENRLMVDVHDNYRPTGIARTWPNLMTVEGVRGNEHMPTSAHNTTLPFTRFLAGPADYTICYFTPRLKTTRAHQLALSVIFYSPWQFLFWYDRPSQVKNEPELEFFRAVPTVWDETRVLDGAIGEKAVVARRRGEDWFVGAITNQRERTVELPLSFLHKGQRYEVKTFCDGESPTDVELGRRTLTSRSKVVLDLAANGGCAVWLRRQ